MFVTNRSLRFHQLRRGVLLRPLLCRLEIGLGGVHHLVRYGLDQRVRGVRLAQQLHDRQQHLADGEGGRPVVLDRVQANHSIRVYVAVVDARAERDLRITPVQCGYFRRLEGVILREMNIQEEDASFVGRVLRAVETRFPIVSTPHRRGRRGHIRILRRRENSARRIQHDVREFRLNPTS